MMKLFIFQQRSAIKEVNDWALSFVQLLQTLKIKSIGARPWADPEKQREPAGDLYGMVFQNISIAAKSVCGEPEILWGGPDRLIYGLVFDNVTIGNDTVGSIDYFYHNEYVFDLPKL